MRHVPPHIEILIGIGKRELLNWLPLTTIVKPQASFSWWFVAVYGYEPLVLAEGTWETPFSPPNHPFASKPPIGGEDILKKTCGLVFFAHKSHMPSFGCWFLRINSLHQTFKEHFAKGC